MIKLVDQLSPMGNFAVATATDIVCSDNERLQDKIDNGTLGGDNSIITTEAEYLALPEEEKLNNSYYLYDIGVHYKNGVQYGASDAEDIGYNNAESGIQATTVQGAIDKVVKTVEDKVDKTNIVTALDNTVTDEQVTSALLTKTELDKKASKTYLGRYVFETGVDSRLLYIGKIYSIGNQQGFTNIEVRGGRADGNFGHGYIHININGYVVANLEHPISNMTFFVTKEGNEANLYCNMDTYCTLVVDVTNGSKCEVIGEFVDSSSGTIYWNNDWRELATMDKVESKYEEAILATPVDWNTLNTKARYYVSGGAIMTNAPMQQPFGELVVETVGDSSVCRVQKFFSFDGRLYMRRWTGSVWNEWYKFDGTAN